MIFNNVIVYKLVGDIEIELESLEDDPELHRVRDPGPLELSASGFTAAYPHGPVFMRLPTGRTSATLFAIEHRTRVIPPAALRREWEAEIKRREDDEGRTLSRRERYRLKQETYETMLPKAFITNGRIQAILMGNYLLVDSSSHKAAEHLISNVRAALGTFPVVPWKLSGSTKLFMNAVRLGDNDVFQLSGCRNIALFKEIDKASVTTKDFDIQREETSELVRNGASLTKLGICWNESVDFVLSDDLTLRRVRFTETLKDQVNDDAGDDADRETIFEASALIFAGTMEGLIRDLANSIGDDTSNDEEL